ncbi:MAG TPA: pyridoxamine 5'-phosphate oxidase family protein [Streptosporangiaceae bacterium]|nr:pyridoxamine 5'-phosphate oxidase family protein [Streptosporangiaceae bacterium]
MAGDEQARARAMQPRRVVELAEEECWALLGSVSVGRVVFTMKAMPAVRPVNHLLDGKTVIIRSHLGAAIAGHAAGGGAVVCYEADDIDLACHTGWSVVATGLACLVRPAEIARYERLLEPWAAGQMDHFIAITPQAITGIRLIAWCT